MSAPTSANVTERTLELPDGIKIFYHDSGPVPGSSDYTTLVTLHGTGFNGDGFQPLIDHAARMNFRVINWNRRNYHGSTPYSEEELDDLRAGRKVFFDKHAAHIAWFLEHLVKVENVPKPDAERKKRGIVVMGWSFGNATSLIEPKAIEKPVYEIIEPYLLSVFLYEPPYHALGIPDPQYPVYHPFSGPEELAEGFQRWVSSYYDHPASRLAKYESADLDYGRATGRYTLEYWTDEQRSAWFEGDPVADTELPAFGGEQRNALRRQTELVIYDEAQVSTFFPRVTLVHNIGENTVWQCMHGYQVSKKRYEEAVTRGEKPRKTTFLFTKGTNHFLHYEYPVLLLQQVLDGLSA